MGGWMDGCAELRNVNILGHSARKEMPFRLIGVLFLFVYEAGPT